MTALPAEFSNEPMGGGAMTDALLMLVVPGVLLIALAVDLAVLVGWAHRIVDAVKRLRGAP